jgi:fatty acid synthase subunit alpha, fungi type
MSEVYIACQLVLIIMLQLHGFAEQEAKKVGAKNVTVSISHSDDQAIAVAVAAF